MGEQSGTNGENQGKSNFRRFSKAKGEERTAKLRKNHDFAVLPSNQEDTGIENDKRPSCFEARNKEKK